MFARGGRRDRLESITMEFSGVTKLSCITMMEGITQS